MQEHWLMDMLKT